MEEYPGGDSLADYDELARLWHHYLTFGPPIDQATFTPADFVAWLDTAPANTYGLADVERFFADKEWREGTALRDEREWRREQYEQRQQELQSGRCGHGLSIGLCPECSSLA